MIRGNIAIPDLDPKTWRAKAERDGPSRNRVGDVTPAKVQEQTGSAIVEPKRRSSNAMLTHLPEDITDAERDRRADMAEEMFREIKRRAGNNG
jgi:hypothetical protein